MKPKPILLLNLLALSALLWPVPPQLLAETNAILPRLTAARQGDNVVLRWIGGPGIRLQQAGCLCGLEWQDVPDHDTNCAVVLPMAAPAEFYRLVDANADTDADLLTRGEEEAGWTIFVDTSGYGESRVMEIQVTSNPELEDTDGDGLTDGEEWIFGTDPRSRDTDHDGLSDYEEVFRWLTSPTSVDTDGDARGPNHDLPPKAMLFDGHELRVLHTSPTLEDTDGDGRTDYEEYDQVGRNPLVAEVPKLGVELVDAVDIRLDVEYAEELGTTHEYGGELTVSDATRNMYSTSASLSWEVTVGAQLDFVGPFPAGGNVNTEVSVGGEVSVGFETESSHSVERSQSDYLTDSRTRTETAASGSMSGGIRLKNTGPVTYTITDLGMTVRYMQPGAGADGKPSLQTLATLIPTLGANGITLAPGDSTPVLQVSATDLNASRVKQFMARPNSLYLEPAFYELENAQGLNFDYLEEVTRWRTARVQIDYGNGTSEEYRVATNVERYEDGTYAGVTMGNVMSNILRIPFQTVPRRNLQTNSATNERVLFSVREIAATSPTNGFWAVVLPSESTLPAHTDFENIVLQASDQVLLVFVRDDDGDGLFSAEEQHYRTDAVGAGDSDRDGLSDVFEVRTGWAVSVTGRPTYHVYSDPAQADQDGDGLTDSEEYNNGVNSTDPTRLDTDDDGIPDGLDQFPLVPAKVLRVKWDAVHGGNGVTNGATWDTAFTNLQDALTRARAGDVAEIWVAAGVYKPTTTTTNRNATFLLVHNTALYGGFTGVETKLSQREPDPFLNDTILSGDLLGNDTSTPWDDPSTYNDNSLAVCSAESSIGAGTALDGFTITGGSAPNYGGGVFSLGRPKLKNLLFRANYGLNGAGLYLGIQTVSPEPYIISDCVFLQNGAPSGGGMRISAVNPQLLIVTNCQFYQNAATGSGALDQGGGAVVVNGRCVIADCIFAWNTSVKWGGAISVLRATQTPTTILGISRCKLIGNTATLGGGGIYMTDFISTTGDLKVEVLQSEFWGNSAPSGYGGAIWASGNVANKRLYVLNSCMVSNTASSGGGAFNLDYCPGWIENTILWGNPVRLGAGTTLTVRTTCLAEANSYPGNGNINADPKFVDLFGGNLRLGAGSPCIDRGNNYMDYHPTVPGFQSLPDTDMDGNWRIVDGNGDGTATVDMGAYERQGP